MDKDELITMLRILKDNCFPADGGMATVIYDVTQDSFLWVMEETIEFLKEAGTLVDFIEELGKAAEKDLNNLNNLKKGE